MIRLRVLCGMLTLIEAVLQHVWMTVTRSFASESVYADVRFCKRALEMWLQEAFESL